MQGRGGRFPFLGFLRQRGGCRRFGCRPGVHLKSNIDVGVVLQLVVVSEDRGNHCVGGIHVILIRNQHSWEWRWQENAKN